LPKIKDEIIDSSMMAKTKDLGTISMDKKVTGVYIQYHFLILQSLVLSRQTQHQQTQHQLQMFLTRLKRFQSYQLGNYIISHWRYLFFCGSQEKKTSV
jgi:hypothetical protein